MSELERKRSIEHDAIPHYMDESTDYEAFSNLPLDKLLDRLKAACRRMDHMNGGDVCYVLSDLIEQADEIKKKHEKLLVRAWRIERVVQELQIHYGEEDRRIASLTAMIDHLG